MSWWACCRGMGILTQLPRTAGEGILPGWRLDMTLALGSRLSALGSRLLALGSRRGC